MQCAYLRIIFHVKHKEITISRQRRLSFPLLLEGGGEGANKVRRAAFRSGAILIYDFDK